MVAVGTGVAVIGVGVAVGVVLPPTCTLRANCEVFPASSVVVAVTIWPPLTPLTATAKLPFVPVTPEPTNVLPWPKFSPLALLALVVSAINTSTVQPAHALPLAVLAEPLTLVVVALAITGATMPRFGTSPD